MGLTTKNPPKYFRTYRPRIKMNFTQHVRHIEMLHKMQKYLGAGKVSVASKHNQAELVISDRNDLVKVINQILPHLVLKRQQAILALEILSQFGKNLRTNRILESDYLIILEKIIIIRSLNSGTGGKRNFSHLTP